MVSYEKRHLQVAIADGISNHNELDGDTSSPNLVSILDRQGRLLMNYNGSFQSADFTYLLKYVQFLEERVQNLEEEFRLTITSTIAENQALKWEAHHDRFTGNINSLEDLRQRYEAD